MSILARGGSKECGSYMICRGVLGISNEAQSHKHSFGQMTHFAGVNGLTPYR